MNVKLGRKKRLKRDNFKVEIATVDYSESNSIYINISGWLEPLASLDNYHFIIKELNNRIKKYLYKNIDTNFFHKDNFIIDCDMKKSKIEYNKKTHFYYEFTLYQNNDTKFNLETINNATELTNRLIDNTFLDNQSFKFSKCKSK